MSMFDRDPFVQFDRELAREESYIRRDKPVVNDTSANNNVYFTVFVALVAIVALVLASVAHYNQDQHKKQTFHHSATNPRDYFYIGKSVMTLATEPDTGKPASRIAFYNPPDVGGFYTIELATDNNVFVSEGDINLKDNEIHITSDGLYELHAVFTLGTDETPYASLLSSQLNGVDFAQSRQIGNVVQSSIYSTQTVVLTSLKEMKVGDKVRFRWASSVFLDLWSYQISLRQIERA